MRVWLTPRPGRFAHGEKTRYPLYSRLGEGPRPVWTGAENLPPPPTGMRSPDCRTRSKSLYRRLIPIVKMSRGTPFLYSFNFYYLSDVRWAEHVALCRGGVYRGLVGKHEGRRPLGRPRHKWEDNIKIDLKRSGMGIWTGSIWLRIGTGGELL